MTTKGSVRYFAVTAVLLAGLLLAGCARPAPGTPAPAQAPPREEVKKQVSIACTGTGTTYIMATALGTLLTLHAKIEAAQEVFSGTFAMFQRVTTGEADLVAISPLAPTAGMYGELGADWLKIRMRLLCSGSEESMSWCGIFTRPDTGIKTVADLRGKQWYADQAGTPQWGQLSRGALKANNMTKDDVKWRVATTGPDAQKDIIEKRVDAWTYLLGAGTIEMAQSRGLFIVPLGPAEQKAIAEVNPAYIPAVVKKGDRGANADTPIVASPTSIWISPKVNEITGYTIIKTLYDHAEEFQKVHSSASGFKLKYAMDVWAIPYHPGAIKYLKEVGMWTASHDARQAELLKKEKELTGW